MPFELDKEFLDTPLYGPRGFDFSGVERNLAFETMMKKEGVTNFNTKMASTGTTIVASVYKGGVIVGADSRSTAGNIIGDKQCMKLHKLTDRIYAAGAGTAADLEKVTKMIAAELKLFELNEAPKKARVIMAHRRLRQYLFQYQGYVSAYLLIGGVDFQGAHLYEVSASGCGYSIPYSADGSGGYAAISELEDGFEPEMTEEACRKLVIKALEAGMHGDNMSGNSYNLVTITQEGKRLEGPFVPSFATRQKLEGDNTFEPGTTIVLKEKQLKSMEQAGNFGKISNKPAAAVNEKEMQLSAMAIDEKGKQLSAMAVDEKEKESTAMEV